MVQGVCEALHPTPQARGAPPSLRQLVVVGMTPRSTSEFCASSRVEAKPPVEELLLKVSKHVMPPARGKGQGRGGPRT